MREILIICSTCIAGWLLSCGVMSVREVQHWQEIDRAARAQAELSLRDIRGGIGVELSPAIR